MFGSTALDVAIGLVLAFLSVSLICSAIREFIETLLKSRAMDLERGLRELLGSSNAAGMVFNHPVIKGLYGGTYLSSKLKGVWGWVSGAGGGQSMGIGARRALPSYIPANQFAVALLDLLTQGDLATLPATGAAAAGVAAAGVAPAVPPAPAAPAAAPAPVTIASLRASAALIQDTTVQRVLVSALDMAGDDIQKARANLENWFNGTMDRVSGWYKRRTQFILFAIGLCAAVVLNVDAITIATHLGSDEPLRQAIVASASAIVQAGEKTDATPKPGNANGGQSKPADQANGQSPAVAAPPAAGEPAASGGAAASGSPSLTQEWESIAGLQANLEAIGLPIGWRDWSPVPQSTQVCSQSAKTEECQLVFDWCSWSLAQMILGWLITAFAVTLGAPFWFDVLNSFMKMRGTIKPDEKKQKAA